MYTRKSHLHLQTNMNLLLLIVIQGLYYDAHTYIHTSTFYSVSKMLVCNVKQLYVPIQFLLGLKSTVFEVLANRNANLFFVFSVL